MAYQALYRSCRPERFRDIVAQEPITTTLKNQILNDRIAHAYLFCGSRGTGKTTTARVFARAINCLTPENGFEPCGRCAVCREFLEERSMDLVEIDAASNNGVDEIRDLRDKVKYPPVTARRKVYIIDEVHMLSTGAFNALLKTLEEPPEHAVFLLATTEPNKLPATILSRCQRFDFKRYSADTIVSQMRLILQGIGAQAEDEALAEIARAAEGGMRDALSLLDMCLAYGEDRVSLRTVREALGTSGRGFLFSFAEKLLTGDAAGALSEIDALMRDGRDAQAFAREVTGHLRALMVARAMGPKAQAETAALLECTGEDAVRYHTQALQAPEEKLMRMMEAFMQCESDMKWASQPRTALEMCAFLCCRPGEQLRLDALSERVARLEALLQNGLPAVPAAASQTAAPSAGEELPPFDMAPPPQEPAEAPPFDIPQPAKRAAAPKVTNPPEKAAPKAEAPGHEKWEQALKALSQSNRALQMPLSKARFSGVEQGCVVLEYAKNDRMFLQILDKEEKKRLISEALTRSFGQETGIILRLQGTAASPDPERTDTIRQAREVFGREHVDFLD